MDILSILTPERTQVGLAGGSKKKILETLAQVLSNDLSYTNADELFTNLINRERLGSTGIGHGIAIPHCRIENCTTATGALFRLANPVDFDAIDRQRVDLLFVLIVPVEAHETHLEILASLATLFSREEFCASLREARTDLELYQRMQDFHLN